jgi:heterodisulfide reductase subunit C/nitrate reductase gamma subunit
VVLEVIMLFDGFLYGSLLVCLAGLVYRVNSWFSRSLKKDYVGATDRLLAALMGTVSALFSKKAFTILKTFILDVLFQARILKEDTLRWVMHILIFWGFMLLLFMHALEKWISLPMFSDYSSTINPFFFLRDLFGVMVLAGAAIALYRRFILKVPRLKTRGPDIYAVAILFVIMISGILLQGAKTISHRDFLAMVKDYADTDEKEAIDALEAYWVSEMGLWSPTMNPPFDHVIIKKGYELHKMSCLGCHSKPQWAFASYASALAMRPAAPALDKANAPYILWMIHIMACFLGLAYLPFSKMLHVIATPLSLLINAVSDPEKCEAANTATRQALELDACTQCGTCSLMCSSAPASSARGNPFVLPSEKMRMLRQLAAGKVMSKEAMEALREGVYLCTSCERCTVVCPSGINLKALWSDMREEIPVFVEQGEPLLLSPFAFAEGISGRRDLHKALDAAWRSVIDKWEPPRQEGRILELPHGKDIRAAFSRDAGTFSVCFGCRNCTNVCPVVRAYEEPEKALGLLPHQIMACLGMGFADLACGSAMLWNCLTCYQCQEHCPQMVEVTDILYELKNISARSPGSAGNHLSTS